MLRLLREEVCERGVHLVRVSPEQAVGRTLDPNFDVQAQAGACLVQAQNVVGAGGGPYSATVAANATKYRHTGSLPRDSIAVVWFSHWGTYQDYRNGQFRWEDWGHVVIWNPGVFEGAGGFYSSPRSNVGGEWFRTIADIEHEFNSSYRFWSEDINGVRVCAPIEARPAAKPAAKPAVKPKPKPDYTEEDEEMSEQSHAYARDAATKGQGSIYMILNGTGKKRKLSKEEWTIKRDSQPGLKVAEVSKAYLDALPDA